MVKEKWQSYSVQGNEILKIKEKLKLLKGDLKIWNRDVYGNLHTAKRNILREIEALDNQDFEGDAVGSVSLVRMDLTSRLRDVDRKIDSLICQKARSN